MGYQRIKGDALMLTLDGTDRWSDCTQVLIDQDEQGQETLLDGSVIDTGIGWHMDVSAVQSTAEGSLWRLLFEHAQVWVDYVYAPHGNPDPEPDRPHFTGRAFMPLVTTLGGEAGADSQYVFTVTMPLDGRPTLVTQ